MATLGINDIKKGVILKLDNDIWLVTLHEAVKPGKGSAFTRARLKSITRGTTLERTFKDVDKVEGVEVEKRRMTFSYVEGADLVLMDTTEYENYNIPKEMVGEVVDFLLDNMEMEVTLYEGKPVACAPPNFVELEVTYAEEGLKGDTSGTARKQVTVQTGGKINVPIFVKQGDRIKIDLRDISYVERVK